MLMRLAWAELYLLHGFTRALRADETFSSTLLCLKCSMRDSGALKKTKILMLPDPGSKPVSSLLLPFVFVYFAITNFYLSSKELNPLDRTSKIGVAITLILIATTFFIPKMISKSIYKTKLYRKEAFNSAIALGIIALAIFLLGTIPFDRKTPQEWSAGYFNLFLIVNLVQTHKYLKKHGYDKQQEVI